MTENLNEGIDTIHSSVSLTIVANVENLTLTGNANLNGTGNGLANVMIGNGGNNTMSGGGGGDRLEGGGGADILDGGAAADTILGGNGGDQITGGTGADILTGGVGSDWFIFNAIGHSAPGAFDTITDFLHLTDIINLSAIDARTGANGNQAFAYGGQTAGAVANSVTWYESDGNTFVQADVNGNMTADLLIMLSGINHRLTAADFLL